MFFSVDNLIDNAVSDGDSFAAAKRTYATHGVTTSQSVFWNTEGQRYMPEVGEYRGKPTRNDQILIRCEQWGDGYVIGTRGPASKVIASNYSEGLDKGDSLEPASLYLDQLQRRLSGTH